ncbi:MAG: hypothetical protein KGS00_00835 [Alphaproteobacteria bacterium]|nr:hypothetical protein [Alphaproteobacteria bacterium]
MALKGLRSHLRISPRPVGAILTTAIFAWSCQSVPTVAETEKFADCPAAKAAYQVTDDFMRTFNSKDAEVFGSVFHFPSVRIASGNVLILKSPADLEASFVRLAETGWDRSEWASREVVQCGPTKAHMLTTFVRYRADGSEISRFDSLYIVEYKNGRWGLTARSSFAN